MIYYQLFFSTLTLPAYEENHDFDVKGYSLLTPANIESANPPNLVRVGLIQHHIVMPTHCPIKQQRDAIHEKMECYINHAGRCAVNVLCFQEAWSMHWNFIILLIFFFFSDDYSQPSDSG